MRLVPTRCLSLLTLAGYFTALAAGLVHDHGGAGHMHPCAPAVSMDDGQDSETGWIAAPVAGCGAARACAHPHRSRPKAPVEQSRLPGAPDAPVTPEHGDECSVCQFLAQKPMSASDTAVVASVALTGRTEHPQPLWPETAAPRLSLSRGPPSA